MYNTFMSRDEEIQTIQQIAEYHLKSLLRDEVEAYLASLEAIENELKHGRQPYRE
jgi:hypothetical protein